MAGKNKKPKARGFSAISFKNKIQLLAVVVAFAVIGVTAIMASRAAVGSVPLGVGGNWNYVWGDEFNGTSLDTNKWATKEPWNGSPGFVQSGESWCPVPATSDVISFTGSSIKLNAVKKPAGGKEFQSCFITSRGYYETFKHGYVEARLKIPTGARLWSAYWLLGNGTLSDGKEWPKSGEIDMFEFVNNGGSDGEPFYTVHWHDPSCPWGHCQRTQSDPWPAKHPSFATQQYMTFGIKRTSTELAIYIDGKLMYKRSPTDRADGNGPLLAQYLFDGLMHLRFDLSVGGDWATDPNRAAQPGSLEIDYVRVWEPGSGTVDPTPTNPVAIPFRMNAGGASHADGAGNTWLADAYHSGGSQVDRGAVAIANTTDDRLYQTERWGMSGYNIPVANGTYKYRLHFAETSPACTVIGCRVQSITTEGTPFLTNFDILKETGHSMALVKEGVATVSDGVLNIGMSHTANATMLNAIEILPNEQLALPDVVVTDVSMTPANPLTGQQVVFSATVKNQGAGPTPAGAPIGVRFDVDGIQTHWAAMGPLPAGGSMTIQASNSMTLPDVPYWTATGGAHTLEAWVDDVNRFTEANESNNKLAKPFTVYDVTIRNPGDANGDQRVNALDLSILLTKDGQNYPAADFNNDGTVGAADLSILLGKWTW